MLLVDAYNVIRAQWALPAERRGLDIRGLIDLIGKSRFAHRRLRVVVDGTPGPDWIRRGVAETVTGLVWTRVGKAEVVFSGRGFEADDVIEDILRRSKGIEITVVSSDRRLVDAAGRAGADQIGNGSFLRLLDDDHARRAAEALPAFVAEVPLDRYSIAHWMREFGFDPRHLEQPDPPKPPAPTPANLILPTPAAPAPSLPRPARPPKPPKGSFGSRLSIPKPAVPAPILPRQPEPPPMLQTPPATPSVPTDFHETLDPLLRDAFTEWYGTLHLADLDMSKWIDGVEPL